jgi:hypothetical protein
MLREKVDLTTSVKETSVITLSFFVALVSAKDLWLPYRTARVRSGKVSNYVVIH